MDFKIFKLLRENYENFISAAEQALNKEKAKTQTKSVWFDRKTIEKLLAQTDPNKGGLKIYLGMYDQETLSEREESPDMAKEYIGKLTLILTASNDNEDPDEESKMINGGKVCPPDC